MNSHEINITVFLSYSGTCLSLKLKFSTLLVQSSNHCVTGAHKSTASHFSEQVVHVNIHVIVM